MIKHKNSIVIVCSVIMFAIILGISSLFLTAPGVGNKLTDLSFRETNSAKTFLNKTLAEQSFTIGDQVYKASELGVSYEENKLVEELNSSKMWNLSSWGKQINIPFTVDEEKLQQVLSSTQQDYKEPVNAAVAFDGEAWVVSPAENGKTLPTETVIGAFSNYNKKVELEIVPASISTGQAEELAGKLNILTANAKIIDKNATNNVRPLTGQEFADLVTITPELKISSNNKNIQNLINQLPASMNKKVQNGVAVVNENQEPIHVIEPWQDGYKLTDTSNLAEQIAKNLESLSTSEFYVEGEVTPAEVKKLYRKVEVDLAARRVYTYENDKLVKEYPVAIGARNTPTFKGTFHVQAQLTVQNMGCTSTSSYCTKNVKWISYFNGDQALHGTYWHNDFGNPNGSARSHGCVNMTEADAYEIYKFAQVGTPVTVR